MNEELALGQRELTAETLPESFTPEEAELCKTNGYTPEDVLQFVKESGTQTINAAIGGMKTETNQALDDLEETPVEEEVMGEKLPEEESASE